MGAIFAPTRFSLVRISVRDLVADGKSLLRNSGFGGGGENLILRNKIREELILTILVDVFSFRGGGRGESESPWGGGGGDRFCSADCKRGRRKGATSKNVKNRQKVSKSFSTLFDNFCAGQKPSKIVKKCQKVFRHFSTIFARHLFSGPFCNPLICVEKGGADWPGGCLRRLGEFWWGGGIIFFGGRNVQQAF